MKGARILIVDDDPIVLIDLEKTVKVLGHVIAASVYSGEEALRKMAETHPDLVLLDLHLKGKLDGVQVAETIVTQFNIPVVYLTVYGDEETTQQVNHSESFEYLLKNSSTREVRDKIDFALYKHEIHKRLQESEEKFRQIQAESQKSAQRLQTMLETVGEGITLSDATGYFEIFNSKMEEITGYTKAEVNQHRDLLKLLYPESAEYYRALAGIQEIRQKTGQYRDVETTVHAKDGTVKTLLVSSAMIHDHNRDWFLSVYRDISQRKQAEEALRESEELFRTLFTSQGEGAGIVDADETFLLANPAAEKILGVPAGGLVGRNLKEFTTAEQFARLRQQTDLRRKGEKSVYEVEFIRLDGEKRYLLVTATPRFDKNEQFIGTFGIFRDITERKRTEQELRIKDMAIASSISGIVLTDLDGRMTYVNKAFLEISGYDEREVAGRTFLEFVPEAEQRIVAKAIETVFSRGQWAGEINIGKKDGTIINVNFLANVVYNTEGMPVCMMASFVDITEQKRAEQARRQLEVQLRQVQKMEALGTLAGGIAHDFNNILSTMLAYTELLLNKHPEPGRERTYLEEIYRAGERAADLVRQILTFSHIEEQDRKPISPVPVVTEALTMIRATLPANIDIHHQIKPDCRPILANATQLQQVLINLCTNAAHAMKETGGLLEVALEDIRYVPEQMRVPKLQEGKLYVKLMVKDGGHGMSSEIRERIFDPFFTTKAVGEGTGLGLSVVHGIVKNHKGTIAVESEPNKGTAFFLFFPAFEGDIQEDEIATIAPERGREHLLIVEDEVALAQYYAISLEELGYRVTIAIDGFEALELFRASPDLFDIVFTDQAMPKISGVQLSQELLHIKPELPIILATGYSSTVSEENAKALGIRYFLMKPIKIGTLTKLIREIRGTT